MVMSALLISLCVLQISIKAVLTEAILQTVETSRGREYEV
jgi:hypothetical protein